MQCIYPVPCQDEQLSAMKEREGALLNVWAYKYGLWDEEAQSRRRIPKQKTSATRQEQRTHSNCFLFVLVRSCYIILRSHPTKIYQHQDRGTNSIFLNYTMTCQLIDISSDAVSLCIDETSMLIFIFSVTWVWLILFFSRMYSGDSKRTICENCRKCDLKEDLHAALVHDETHREDHSKDQEVQAVAKGKENCENDEKAAGCASHPDVVWAFIQCNPDNAYGIVLITYAMYTWYWWLRAMVCVHGERAEAPTRNRRRRRCGKSSGVKREGSDVEKPSMDEDHVAKSEGNHGCGTGRGMMKNDDVEEDRPARDDENGNGVENRIRRPAMEGDLQGKVPEDSSGVVKESDEKKEVDARRNKPISDGNRRKEWAKNHGFSTNGIMLKRTEFAKGRQAATALGDGGIENRADRGKKGNAVNSTRQGMAWGKGCTAEKTQTNLQRKHSNKQHSEKLERVTKPTPGAASSSLQWIGENVAGKTDHTRSSEKKETNDKGMRSSTGADLIALL